MKISRKADYAMRAVTYIANQPVGKRSSISLIAEEESIPRDFLAKILIELARAGILKAYQGVKGGYTLARSTKQINLLNIIETMDGPLGVNLCVRSKNGCGSTHVCHSQVYPFWKKLQGQVRNALKSTTIAKLVNTRPKKKA